MSLDQTTLTATGRTEKGKGPARRLRMKGLIPAVVYGRGTTPLSVALDPAALQKALNTPHRFNTVITVKVEGGGDHLVLLKDYEQHPVTRKVLHADFQEVRLDQEVTVEVPVALTGKAIGTVDGGILSQVTRTLSIKTLPRAIPESIKVDVTGLKIGQSLHASDIVLAEGVKLAGKTDLTIAVVSMPEAEAAPVAAAVVAAPVAGAPAAAGAKGAAPAAAGAKGAAPVAAAAKAPGKK